MDFFTGCLYRSASLWSSAGNRGGAKSDQSQSAKQGSAGIIRISTLVGTTVLDPQGQKLGRIKDVLLDSQTGQVTFVVLNAEAPDSVHPTTYTAARPIDSPSMPAPIAAACLCRAPALELQDPDGRRTWKIFTMNDGKVVKGDLRGIVKAIQLSRPAMRNIRQNLRT